MFTTSLYNKHTAESTWIFYYKSVQSNGFHSLFDTMERWRFRILIWLIREGQETQGASVTLLIWLVHSTFFMNALFCNPGIRVSAWDQTNNFLQFLFSDKYSNSKDLSDLFKETCMKYISSCNLGEPGWNLARTEHPTLREANQPHARATYCPDLNLKPQPYS